MNAGILSSIQNGYNAYQSGESSYGAANLWATFFDGLFNRDLEDRDLISLWGQAEQAVTEYGIAMVLSYYGQEPNSGEQWFVYISSLYRYSASDGRLERWAGNTFAVLGVVVYDLFDDPQIDGAAFGYSTGAAIGQSFQDPRTLVAGHSPVYWFFVFAVGDFVVGGAQ